MRWQDMLNFRKLKQDFSSNILKEGKQLHDSKKVVAAKILKVDSDSVKIGGKVLSNFENTYESEVEIDRFESEMIHSNCDCPYRYDCQHLAALIFYLEEHFNSILVDYSKESDLKEFDQEEKKQFLKKVKEAEEKEVVKKDAAYQKQVLSEYLFSAQVLSSSPFFLPPLENSLLKAELGFIFNPKSLEVKGKKKKVEFQLALRLPFRSKPLSVPDVKGFLQALSYEEFINIAGKKYFFTLDSFDREADREIAKLLVEKVSFMEGGDGERGGRIGQIDFEDFGTMLSRTYRILKDKSQKGFGALSEMPAMPSVFVGSLENSLYASLKPAKFRFELEYLNTAGSKLLINPMIALDQTLLNLKDVSLLESTESGLIHNDVYYPFAGSIKRIHLDSLSLLSEMTVPEPLLGAFVENSLPELGRFGEVVSKGSFENIVTLPYAKELSGRCELSYLDGELEATLYFIYDGKEIHSELGKLNFSDIESFISKEGILARNLVEEKRIIEELFQDFIYKPDSSTYVAKSEKKIVEFMTEIIPRFQKNIKFNCPQNLLDQFIYDSTNFKIKLDYDAKVGFYTVDLKVEGELKGVKLELLWDCISSRRSFVELDSLKTRRKGGGSFSKILVLDLEKISRLVQLFDEIGIASLESQTLERPLWSLVGIEKTLFENLPVEFIISKELQEIREQMLGKKEFAPSSVPQGVKASIRPYQLEGIHWLERLRSMYLNGILADDMGLGKTLQAIVAILQSHLEKQKAKSLIICPTSLLYNWKEEFLKFASSLKVEIVDGTPLERKEQIAALKSDVFITSYTLLQKDVEHYEKVGFNYLILDEAQHIKNRGTRNAKSTKMIKADHKLILTGTPIENSLDELWSLFDFLMPGLLSGYDRFLEKYIRGAPEQHTQNMEYLKRKVSPFILRRMKEDVLKDLPPVSEIVYHCHLTQSQMELYSSYARSAREELVKLVEKEGFEKVHIHVLATLTRLKQICCHPAIFAKEKVEEGDSAKYDMLLELLESLVEGDHKTVIFSQYTKMLEIMREEFARKGIRFSYLDGTSKNRLEIVKEFNEDKSIPIFLVSLKAGGTGLNIVGADTVVHYDMWWNPAVESQASDRVYRIGQKKAVSIYKLVTSGTIEEKIVEMQKRKKGLVKKVVSCDDEAISKLTWEEVLELLQT